MLQNERFPFRLKLKFSLEKGERKVHFKKKKISQVDRDENFPWFYFCSAFSPSVDFDNTLTTKGTSEQHARKIALILKLQQHRPSLAEFPNASQKMSARLILLPLHEQKNLTCTISDFNYILQKYNLDHLPPPANTDVL